jgi:hypothetical protein
MDVGDCSTGVIKTKTGKKMGGQMTEAMYKISITEEYAKINDLSRIITLNSGIAAKIGNLGLMNSMEGTYIWVHGAEAYPWDLGEAVQGDNQDFLQPHG